MTTPLGSATPDAAEAPSAPSPPSGPRPDTDASGAILVGEVEDPDSLPRPDPPRPRIVPTWRVAVAFAAATLVCGLLGLLTGLGYATGLVVLGVAALLAVAFVLDATSLPAHDRLVAVRAHPRVLSLRVAEPFTITIHNLSRRSVRGQLRMPLPAPLVTPADTVEVRVPGSGWTAVRYAVVGLRRGRHDCAPLEYRVTSPLGLAICRYHLTMPEVVPVYPNVKAAKRFEFAVRQKRREDVGLRRTRMIGIGTEFDSLREYRPDDDLRSVDWRATARRGAPVSRQFRVERNQNVLFLVDCGRLMASALPSPDGTDIYDPTTDGDVDPADAVADGGQPGPQRSRIATLVDTPIRRLDIALNAATAMAYVCQTMDDRVGLIAFDRDVHVRISPGRSSRDAILAAMCALEPQRSESDYALAFRIAASMKRAMVVLFTDVLEESAAAPLLAATPTLLRRHLVTAAAVTDPEIEAIATTIPQTDAAAYRQAIAVDMLRRREQVNARLRGLGVDVIQAPPASFSAAMVDAYLRAKALGKI